MRYPFVPIRPRFVTAIALSASLGLQAVPARANPAAAAAVPCLASGACVLVLVGVGFVVVQMANGQRVRVPLESYPTHPYPMPQPGPRPAVPGAVYSQQGRPEDGNIPGVQEVHWTDTEQLCIRLFNKLRSRGVRLTNYHFFRSGMPGARKSGHCVLYGPDATDDRFVDYRHDN